MGEQAGGNIPVEIDLTGAGPHARPGRSQRAPVVRTIHLDPPGADPSAAEGADEVEAAITELSLVAYGRDGAGDDIASAHPALPCDLVRRLRAGGAGLTVSLVEIDGFVALAASLGDEGVETVLDQAAERLRLATCDEDVVARVGADRFAVVTDLPQPTPAMIAAFGHQLLLAFDAPIPLGDQRLSLRATIGVASAAHAVAGDDRDLLHDATTALRDATTSLPPQRVVVFDPARMGTPTPA